METKFFEDAELKKKVVKVKSQLGKKFDYVDVDRVLFVSQVDEKEAMDGKIAFVTPVRSLFRLLNPQYVYFFTVVRVKFDRLNLEGQNRVIEHEMMHFPEKFDGKVVRHDLEDFTELLDKYGVHYLTGDNQNEKGEANPGLEISRSS